VKPAVGGLSLFALGLNGIVGVGIFFAPQLIAAQVPGPRGAWVFAATAALLLPVALAFARLGRALPIDGGPYVWARHAFGERVGFLVGWVSASSAVLSTAAIVSGLRDHLAPTLGIPATPVARALFVFALVAVLTGIAIRGLKLSAWAWDLVTLLKLLPLALLLIAGGALLAAAPPLGSANPVSSSWGRALLVAVFPLQGFEVVPVLAGSARNERSVPRATAGSLVFAALLYAALQWVCARALPDLATQDTPIASAARAVGGDLLGRIAEAGTQVSALGVALGMIVMTPRYVAALGTEGSLGSWLGRLDARGTPRSALLLTSALVALLACSRALSVLFVLSSAAVLAQYVSALAALVALSLRRRVGLTRWSLLPAVLGLGAVALLLASIDAAELPLLLVLLLIGALLSLRSGQAS